MAIRWSPARDRSATMSMRVTGLLILLVSTAGCSGSRPAASPRSIASAADPAGASQSARAQPELARGCPDPQSPPGGGRAAVDYVDFLQANGRNYIADLGGNRLTIRPTDLGRVALQVRCSYAAVNDATGLVFGKPRDGDAAFLAPGTNVYGVRGWPPLCRLAAMHDHEWHVYLAYRPDATVATAEPCALHRGS